MPLDGARTRTASATVELISDDLRMVILPDKGCDIYQLIDRQSGIDVLFKAPWGLRRSGAMPHASSSAVNWITQYSGGWQLLLPNAGAECEEQGVQWGFHGEAGVTAWNVDEVGTDTARFSVNLLTAPLTVEREIALRGSTVMISEQVANDSPDAVEFTWGHHPTFGAPFLAAGCRISTSAAAFRADDEAPGAGLEPGSVHRWPVARTAHGAAIDLSLVPGPEAPRAIFGCLVEFKEPAYTLLNPRLGLGVRLHWSAEVFPYAWYWQEVHATAGFPWFRRAYATAIEPTTTRSSAGLTVARTSGSGGITLAGGQTRSARLELQVFKGRELPAPDVAER